MTPSERRTRRRVLTVLLLSGLFLGLGTTGAAALDLLALLNLRPQPPLQRSHAPDRPASPATAPALAAPVPADPPGDPSLPPPPPGSGAGRRVVYANGAQRVWLVNTDGSVRGTWLVSGRRGSPPPGNYEVFSRSRHARAEAPGVTMEFMVRFARTPGLPIGFHAIPVNRRGRPLQTIEELGTFQSLGCVRQRYGDAVVMWEFAQIGTPVVVLP